MRLTRPPAVASWFLALVCFALFTTSLGAACSAGQRQDALRTTFVAANSARDAYVAWDLRHQQYIVQSSGTRALADQRLAEYHAQQDAMAARLTLAYQGIALASVEQSDQKVSDAIRLVQDLIEAFKRLKQTSLEKE